MKHVHTTLFSKKLQQLLATPELVPSIAQDVIFNGLQVRGSDRVTAVGFGVSASMALFQLAKKKNCDAIIVHHGLMLTHQWLDRMTHDRFAFLIKNNISLFSYHFLLDAHPVLGHAAQVLKTIGITKTKPFMFHDAPWGRVGDFSKPKKARDVVATLSPFLSPDTIYYAGEKPLVKTVAVVTGKGAPYSQQTPEIRDSGIDMYITGEVHEWNREACAEAGLHFLAGGHYHTESFGLRALQNVVQKKWGIATTWLDLPNNV